tara:strand:+ start:237 stop:872 length:636 start_codon:yes stop_codon:yes gene_type:complete
MGVTNLLDYKDVEPKLSLLIKRHDSILYEYKNNVKYLEFKDFTKEQKHFIEVNDRGYPINYESYAKAKHRNFNEKGWHIAPLYVQEEKYNHNTKMLPILSDTLYEIGELSVCALNVLDSGQSLDWHFDQDYIPGVQLLRILWGLDIDPSDEDDSVIEFKNEFGIESKKMVNKEFYIFHPMTRHRVENNMSSPRTLLCIDYITDPEHKCHIL